MGIFGSREPRVVIVKQAAGKRVLSLYEFIEDKASAKAYAKEFAHVAPDRLEFMDRVTLWEGIYIPMREKEGWLLAKGNRISGERFKIEWEVGEEKILAEQDDWNGTITERLKKKKS